MGRLSLRKRLYEPLWKRFFLANEQILDLACFCLSGSPEDMLYPVRDLYLISPDLIWVNLPGVGSD